MRRTVITLLLQALLGARALGQFTTVTGTVTDPNGLPYALGTITPTIVASNTPKFTATGNLYFPPQQASGLDTSGKFIVTLADNTLLTPGGSTWSFTVCSAVGTVPLSFGLGPQCFTVTGVTISGSSQDIGATLRAAAKALTVNFGAGTLSGTGTNNTIPIWTGTTSLGNSTITRNAGTSQLSTPDQINLSGNNLVSNTSNAQPALFVSQGTGSSSTACNATTLNFTALPAPGCVAASLGAAPSNNAGTMGYVASTVSDLNLPIGTPALPNVSVGLVGSVHASTLNNLGDARGLFGVVADNIGGGTLTTMVGVYGEVMNLSGSNATNARAGYFVNVYNSPSSGATNSAEVFIDSPQITSTATLAHHYGLFIADQTGNGSGTNSDPHGLFVAGGGIQQTIKTFTALPACAAATAGEMIPISDANTGTFNANITAGGGANQVIAYCNGTNWTAH